MRRFLFFPPLIAVWLVSAQFGIMAIDYLGSYLSISIISRVTDVYYHTPVISVAQFIPAAALGLVVGCLFAAAHLAFHPIRTAKESAILLTQNLLKSGVVVAVLIVLFQGTFLLLMNQFFHRRYHAYPPDMIWMNWIGLIQPFLVFAALLWALRATFKAKPTPQS